jgi:hypothetical protein
MDGQGIQPRVAVPSRSGDLQGKQSVLPHFSDRQRCRHSPVLHANGNCSLYLKKIVISAPGSSVAHCTASDSVNPCSSSVKDKKKSFCWNGFCARALFNP